MASHSEDKQAVLATHSDIHACRCGIVMQNHLCYVLIREGLESDLTSSWLVRFVSWARWTSWTRGAPSFILDIIVDCRTLQMDKERIKAGNSCGQEST